MGTGTSGTRVASDAFICKGLRFSYAVTKTVFYRKLQNQILSGMVVHAFYPSTWEQRQADLKV